tara:strand:- start:10 stop:342 length:333 start_codon:yes stop_codon:yes gene_type:complete
MFFLPYRYSSFDFVDNVPTGIEPRPSVGGADPDPYGHVADLEEADSVLADDFIDGEALFGFVEDALAFFVREFLVCGVFEAFDWLAFVVVADPAFEAEAGSGLRGFDLSF